MLSEFTYLVDGKGTASTFWPFGLSARFVLMCFGLLAFQHVLYLDVLAFWPFSTFCTYAASLSVAAIFGFHRRLPCDTLFLCWTMTKKDIGGEGIGGQQQAATSSKQQHGLTAPLTTQSNKLR